jgi:C4-dicarboxylate-binding protein DctP
MEDFKNLKIRTTDSPVAKSYMKSLGAKPVYTEDTNHQAKGIEAFETTFARLPAITDNHSKFINVTEHSLFLTSIIMNKSFYDSLPNDLKDIVSKAVISTAKLERTDSIKDNDDQRKLIETNKTAKVVDISKELKEEMKKTADQTVKKYNTYFTAGLIDQIKSK